MSQVRVSDAKPDKVLGVAIVQEVLASLGLNYRQVAVTLKLFKNVGEDYPRFENRVRWACNYWVRQAILVKKDGKYFAGKEVVDVLGQKLDNESVSPNPTDFPNWLTYSLKKMRCPCGYTEFRCMRCKQVFYVNNDIKAHLLKEHNLIGYSDNQQPDYIYYKTRNHYCDFEAESYTNLLRHLLDVHKQQEWAGIMGVNHQLVRMSYVTGIVNCFVIWEKFKSPRAISQLHRYFDVPLHNLVQLFGSRVFRIDFAVITTRVERLLRESAETR